MRISIIIPTLNEAAGIAQALERALACGADEVIVVDGGSDDATTQIIQAGDCLLVESPRGRGIQQNQGAAAATGDVLLFLHADCWLTAEGLSQIRHAMSDPAALAGAFHQRIEADGRLYRDLKGRTLGAARSRGIAYGDQGLFFRREFFEDIGRFPEVALMEDLLLSRRVRACTRWVLLDGPLFVSPRRWKKHGVIRQTARNWMLLAAERLGISPDTLAAHYALHVPDDDVVNAA